MSFKPGRQEAAKGYLPTLDGWRTVAILGVMVSHSDRLLAGLGIRSANVFATISWLRLGVDLFFAISGFLICNRLILELQASGTISLKNFYLRRTFRILPLYMGYLILLSLATRFASVPASRQELQASFLFYRNYVSPPEGAYTNHFWSLAVEEHFYFLWPLLLVSLRLAVARWVTPLLAFLVHCWRAFDAHWLLVERTFPNSYLIWRTDTRLDALLWGCFAALMYTRYPVRFPAWMTPVILAAIVGCVYFHVPMQPFFFATLFPLLILSTISHPSTVVGRFLEWAPLRWLGRLSFSLYVWQTIFLQTSSSPDPGWLAFLKQWPTNLLMIFLLAVASHYLLEKPMICVGRQFLQNPTRRMTDPVPT